MNVSRETFADRTPREVAASQWAKATRDRQELLYLWHKLLDIEEKLDRLLAQQEPPS